jgi:pilus assembly protein Flp/PilA
MNIFINQIHLLKGRTQMEFIKNFLKDDKGASAVEYAVLVGAIGAVLIGGIYSFYGTLNTKIDSAATAIGTSS